MIYICKKKSFEKMAKKILPDYDYFIIDGEDTGSSVSTAKTISDTFSHCTSDGNFTPPRKLIKILTEDDDDDDYAPDKVEDIIDDYFDNRRVKASMIKAVKTMFALSNANKPIPEINVFIVLPNKVYKAMGIRFLNEYKKLFKNLPQFIYMEDVLKENKKILGKKLSKEDLNKVSNRISDLEDKVSKGKKDKDKKDKHHDEDDKMDKKKKKKDKKKKHKDEYSFGLTDDLDRFLWSD